jgi:hypothetical protein
MPLISTLAAIAGIASAGISGGLAIDNAVSGPGTTPPTPSTTPTPAQQQQTISQQKAAVSQQLPSIEGLTSGYANPGYYAQQGAAAAGTPQSSNTALQAVEQAFGFPPGTLSSGGGGGGGAPATKPYTPAGTGTASDGAFPNSPVDLSNFVNSFVST